MKQQNQNSLQRITSTGSKLDKISRKLRVPPQSNVPRRKKEPKEVNERSKERKSALERTQTTQGITKYQRKCADPGRVEVAPRP